MSDLTYALQSHN